MDNEFFFDKSVFEDKKPQKPSESKGNKRSSLYGKQMSSKAASCCTSLFLPLSLLYMEIMARGIIFKEIFNGSFILLLTFSLMLGFFFSAICRLMGPKVERNAISVILFIFAAIISAHIGYNYNFQAFFCLATVGEATNAITDFYTLIIDIIKHIWFSIFLMMLPFIGFMILRRFMPKSEKRNYFAVISCSLCCLIMYSFSLAMLYSDDIEYGTNVYTYIYARGEIEETYYKFGFINTTRLDIKQSIFGEPEETLDIIGDNVYNISSSDLTVSQTDISQAVTQYNITDIDFNKLAQEETDSSIKSMHQYVAGQSPTNKNDYTGFFEGKNLIMFTLEGFSGKIIDPEFTPTLYKMATTGFVMNNYYHPSWGGSTASGEYTNLTGNIYFTTECMSKSAKTLQPLTMANMLKKEGYSCLAYHNNTYTYYNRHKSHPNFGYVWKGVGNGITMTTTGWPSSDLELAEQTVDELLSCDKFHAYYMSFSGHGSYDVRLNTMSKLHIDDLPAKYDKYPNRIRCYLACQYEVELMMKYLVEKLEGAGKLDDTVFVMAPDHYPYVMEDSYLSTLYGLPKENIKNNVELYKNSLIIWSSSMENPVVVDKVCSSIDILPTLLNLWNLEYDSEAIAPIRLTKFSWVTEQGSFDSKTNKFTPKDICTIPKDQQEKYVDRINKIIKSKSDYSKKVLDKNYYKYVFK